MQESTKQFSVKIEGGGGSWGEGPKLTGRAQAWHADWPKLNLQNFQQPGEPYAFAQQLGKLLSINQTLLTKMDQRTQYGSV